MERIAFFAGSFDPFTVGHQSVVERALTLFDKVIIGLGINSEKHSEDEIARRAKSIAQFFSCNSRVEVCAYDGLTCDAARQHECTHLLRGVRSVADFEYERNMADANRNLSGLETVILYTLPELAWISSALVRDLQRHGADTSSLTPIKTIE